MVTVVLLAGACSAGSPSRVAGTEPTRAPPPRRRMARGFRVLVRKIKRRGFELGNLQAYLEAAASARR
ncbi:hypothetical protein ACIBQX_09585 [Nonomuraea sp. NPDC049714]|uniref:hypothetical protein n=1 Tax=Nonomuraea sp. NPDC049714 TaxID=3364357 RepID=UPI00378DD290